MSKEIIDNINKDNFNFVLSKISELECVPFFGTLLGLSRSKSLIKNDDDIDFLINREDVVKLLDIFENTHLKLDDKKLNFISYINPNYTTVNSIDFYIYDNPDSESFIDLKTSFFGNIKYKKRHSMYIPKKMFYPLTMNEEFQVKSPKNPSEINKFIYGEKWDKPLKKNKEYFIYFSKNKPKVTYNKFLIKMLYLVRIFLEKRYEKFYKEIYYTFTKLFRI